MKDFDRLLIRFHQFGGWRLVCQYARMGVLPTAAAALVRCVIKGKSPKVAYPAITRKVDEILVMRYQPILEHYAASVPHGGQGEDKVNDVPKIIWTAWLQGLDHAPEIVKVCLESLSAHLPGYDVRVLDMDNFRQWVDLPEETIEKYRKGRIPPASFSDLLRLAVLRKYGGVWMDATVYCSGFGNKQLKARWQRIMQSELTLFRYFRSGEAQPVGLSTWFVAAVPGQRNVAAVLDMLLAYWHDFDCLVDYYIIHLFMEMSLRRFPEMMQTMPRENSFHSLLLGNAMANDFNEKKWDELVEHVSIHKLNYRKVEKAMHNRNSYCAHILDIRRPVNT